jgi:hypothetical protein
MPDRLKVSKIPQNSYPGFKSSIIEAWNANKLMLNSWSTKCADETSKTGTYFLLHRKKTFWKSCYIRNCLRWIEHESCLRGHATPKLIYAPWTAFRQLQWSITHVKVEMMKNAFLRSHSCKSVTSLQAIQPYFKTVSPRCYQHRGCAVRYGKNLHFYRYEAMWQLLSQCIPAQRISCPNYPEGDGGQPCDRASLKSSSHD